MLLIKDVRLPRKKKDIFSAIFALLAGFFCIGATIPIGREMLCLPYAEFFYDYMQYHMKQKCIADMFILV